MNRQLLRDLENAREQQQDYEYGSENWLWMQRQIESLEAEAIKQEEDERPESDE